MALPTMKDSCAHLIDIPNGTEILEGIENPSGRPPFTTAIERASATITWYKREQRKPSKAKEDRVYRMAYHVARDFSQLDVVWQNDLKAAGFDPNAFGNHRSSDEILRSKSGDVIRKGQEVALETIAVEDRKELSSLDELEEVMADLYARIGIENPREEARADRVEYETNVL